MGNPYFWGNRVTQKCDGSKTKSLFRQSKNEVKLRSHKLYSSYKISFHDWYGEHFIILTANTKDALYMGHLLNSIVIYPSTPVSQVLKLRIYLRYLLNQVV